MKLDEDGARLTYVVPGSKFEGMSMRNLER